MTVRQAIERMGRETHDICADSARKPPSGGEETRRVTADIDDATPFGIVRAWRVFASEGVREIRGRVSSGGEGVHIRGVVDADAAAVEEIRYAAGDDARRTYMDRTHVLKPTNITFTRKPGGEASPWRADVWRVVDDLTQSSARFGPGEGWTP